MGGQTLSIIIVNWNTCDLLRICLESAYRTTADIHPEVIVVDNGSSDGSPAMVSKEFPSVRLIQNTTNLGFARANNQAFQVSTGDFILLLNSDAFLKEGAANSLVHTMEAHPDIGITGARLVYLDGRPQVSFEKLPNLYSESLRLAGLDKVFWRLSRGQKTSNTHDYYEVGVVSGACLMVRRVMVEQIGLFDENFFMFNEETDLCFRAHAANWKVVHNPAAQAAHVGGGSTGVTPERVLRLYKAKLLYFQKHDGEKAKNQLFMVMRLLVGVKLVVYTLIAKIYSGRVQKATFWRQVQIGLGDFQL